MITITTPIISSFSNNPVRFEFCSDVQADDLSIMVKLCVETAWMSGEFEEIEFQTKLDDNGCGTIDFQHILDECLSFDCPEFGTTRPMMHQSSHRRYQVKYAEQYTLPEEEIPTTQEYSEDILRNITKGGIDSKSGSATDFYFNYIGNLGIPLTWKPDGMKTTCIAPEYMTIMVGKKVGGSLGVAYQLTLNDGTVLPASIAQGSILSEVVDGVDLGNIPVVSFPVGLSALGVEVLGIDPCDVRCYEAWLIGANGAEFGRRKYVLEAHQDCTHYYIFCNSLGGIDTMCVNGTRTEGVSIRKQIGAFPTLETFQFKAKKRQQYSQTTGYNFTRDQAAWMQEFLMATSVKEIIHCLDSCDCQFPDPQDGLYCAIEIPPGNFTIKQDRKYCYNYSFTVRQSNEEVVCTPTLCPCRDVPGVTCEYTTQEISCCPVITATQNARCYVGRSGNFWWFYGWLWGLRNQLNAAGAQNIVINHQFVNAATGDQTNIQYFGVGSPSNQPYVYGRMRVNGNNSVDKIIYSASIEFDFECDGELHRICYTLEEHCVEEPTGNQGWQFDLLEFICEDKDTGTKVCIEIGADDSLFGSSQLLTESTTLSINNGATTMPITLPFSQCFDQEDIIRIIIEREITTTKCQWPLKTFEVKEICNCSEVLPILRIVECSVNANDAGSHCIIVEADLSIYSCPPTNIEIFFRGDNAPNWAPGNWYCFPAVNTIGPNSIDTYEMIAANSVPWSFTTATQLTLNWNTPVSAFDGNAVQIKFGGCDFTTTVFTDSNGQSVTISFPINGLLYFNWNIYGLSLALSENYEPTGPNAEKLMAMQNEAIEQIAILSAAISADPSYTLVSVESAGFCGLCENPLVNLRLQLTFDTCGIITRDFTAEQTDLHGNPCEILLTATT